VYVRGKRATAQHFGLVGLKKIAGTQSFPSDHWGLLGIRTLILIPEPELQSLALRLKQKLSEDAKFRFLIKSRNYQTVFIFPFHSQVLHLQYEVFSIS
jgi:hypothetical protein